MVPLLDELVRSERNTRTAIPFAIDQLQGQVESVEVCVCLWWRRHGW